MRVAWIPALGPVGWFRALGPGQELQRRGHEVAFVAYPGCPLSGADQRTLVETADVVVYNGPAGWYDQRPSELVERRGALVVEIDDNLWAWPDDPASSDPSHVEGLEAALARGSRFARAIDHERVAQFESWVRGADLVVTTTEPLAAVLREHGAAEVALAPNGMQSEWAKPEPPSPTRLLLGVQAARCEGKAPPPVTSGFPVARGKRIAWTGSIAHRADLDPCLRALRRVAAIDGEVEVVTLGPVDFRAEPAWEGFSMGSYVRVLTSGPDGKVHDTVPFEVYYRALAAMNADVAVIPLRPSPFGLSKSAVTLWSWGLMDAAVVCSRTGPYAEQEQAGYPALYVDHESEDQWVEAIRTLLYERPERTLLARRARARVLDRHCFPAAGDAWERALAGAVERKAAHAPGL